VLERLITFFSSLFALRFRDGNVALIKKESFCFSLRLVLNGFSHFLKIFREKKKKKTERKTSSLTKPKETETKFYSVAISLSFHLLIFFFLFKKKKKITKKENIRIYLARSTSPLYLGFQLVGNIRRLLLCL
jgi:hypothetical protein